jgi:hypothetical protein
MPENKVENASLILPSAKEYYEIDGNRKLEVFTIICSPEKVTEIT